MMEVRGNLAKTKIYKQEKKRKKIVNLSNFMKNEERARENQHRILPTYPHGGWKFFLYVHVTNFATVHTCSKPHNLVHWNSQYTPHTLDARQQTK